MSKWTRHEPAGDTSWSGLTFTNDLGKEDGAILKTGHMGVLVYVPSWRRTERSPYFNTQLENSTSP